MHKIKILWLNKKKISDRKIDIMEIKKTWNRSLNGKLG